MIQAFNSSIASENEIELPSSIPQDPQISFEVFEIDRSKVSQFGRSKTFLDRKEKSYKRRIVRDSL